jgi:hypothetical protein
VEPNPLREALRRGLSPTGQLHDELSALGQQQLTSEDDGRAIVEALQRFPASLGGDCGVSVTPLMTVANLVYGVEDRESPAFTFLATEGTPELLRLVRELQANETSFSVVEAMYLLRVAAYLGTRLGAEAVIEAARRPYEPNSLEWGKLLAKFSGRHPERDFLFETLADPLPEGFIAMALLDAANECAIAGKLPQHPFDTPQGHAQLRQWLTNTDPDEFSFAHSAAAALPFLSNPERDELFELAREHPFPRVGMEAAWASAQLGQEIGLQVLDIYCRDPIHFTVAKGYLEELGREDRIPEESKSPDFQAAVNFADYLAGYDVCDRAPDQVRIVDHRTLYWPPLEQELPVWLVEGIMYGAYGLEFDEVLRGVVVGGDVILCFDECMSQRHPEDCYAIECYRTLNLTALPVLDPAPYASLVSALVDQLNAYRLAQAGETSEDNSPDDDDLLCIAKYALHIPPELGYENERVVLVAVESNDYEGWIVCDGDQAAVYPTDEILADSDQEIVLRVHVGRRLLGFEGEPDRCSHAENGPSLPAPESYKKAYEALLAEALRAPTPRKLKLVASEESPLSQALFPYAIACGRLGGETISAAFGRGFEQLVEVVATLPPDEQWQAFGEYGVIASHFEHYAQEMIEIGRQQELLRTIDTLRQRWNSIRGCRELGIAAHQAGDNLVAEQLLVQFRETCYDWPREECMSLLARLWHHRGEADQAQELLLECLATLQQEARPCSETDRELFDEWYQAHRRTYLELFPEGGAEFQRRGLPASLRAD